MALTTKPKSGAMADSVKNISTARANANFNDKPRMVPAMATSPRPPKRPAEFDAPRPKKRPAEFDAPRPKKRPTDLGAAPKTALRPPPRPEKNPMTGNFESEKDTKERIDSYSDYYKKGGVVKKAKGGMVRGAGCATRGKTGATEY